MKKDHIIVLVEDLHHKFDRLVEVVQGIKEQLDTKADKDDITRINERLDVHELGQKNIIIEQKRMCTEQERMRVEQESMRTEQKRMRIEQNRLATEQTRLADNLQALNSRVVTLEVAQ